MAKEKIIYKKVVDLIPNEKNPRKNDNAVKTVAQSIKDFGFKNPLIIDSDNKVWCGNTRLKASKMLGIEEVPCIVADDLTEEQIRKLALIDNKSNELALWDMDLLKQELDDLDMSEYDLDWGIELEKEIANVTQEKPEVEFTEILNEENNYVILQFKTDIDWLQAQSFFDIKQVKAYSTRADGKIKEGLERIGVGRVLDGAKFINKIRQMMESE